MPTMLKVPHFVRAACTLLAALTTIPALAQDTVDRELREEVRLHNQRHAKGEAQAIATLEGRQVTFTHALRIDAPALSPQKMAEFETQMRPRMMREACAKLKQTNAQNAGVSIKYVYNNVNGVTLLSVLIDDATCAAK
jgi:hypothetical protein